MFWATKQKRETYAINVSEEICLVCNQTSKHETIGLQNYFTVYGIPFLPTSKSLFKACGNCKCVKEIKLSKMQNTLDTQSIDLLFSSKKRWRYYVGFYVIGFLILLVLYFVLKYES